MRASYFFFEHMFTKKKKFLMRKSEWGPRLWNFLHACSFAFPSNPSPEQVEAFETLLKTLQTLLPCPHCRLHFNEYLEKCPPDTSCGDTLKDWLIDFHNAVNERLGKPVLTKEQAQAKYESVLLDAPEDSYSSPSPVAIALLALGCMLLGLGLGRLLSRART